MQLYIFEYIEAGSEHRIIAHIVYRIKNTR